MSSDRQQFQIRGPLLARNTAINFLGQVVPLLVAVVAVPFIVRGLGVGRFGIFSLALAVVGYFGIFDLGLGRATTKFVSEALGKGGIDRIPVILWTSLGSQFLLGVVGGISLVMATDILVERILTIPPELMEEAKGVFYLFGLFIPVVICSASLRGTLEAGQRFDLVNAVTIPSSCLTFLLPMIGVLLGFQLVGIIIFLLIARMSAMVAYLMLCFRVYPSIKQSFWIDTKMIRPLFTFGGWVTMCNILIQILGYLDRFLIGTLHGIVDVGYYSVSYDVLSRLGIFPVSLALTLFPAFSALGWDRDKIKCLYARSLKYLVVAMGTIVLIILIFAGDILGVWLGRDWASKSTLVFQMLAIGLFINALAQVPANLLDSIGRPDLRAKIFLSYVFPYVALLWFLITKYGIFGAALALILRAVLEFILFFGTVWRVMGINVGTFVETGFLRGIMAYGGMIATTSFMVTRLPAIFLLQSIAVALYVMLFVLLAWRYVLDDGERAGFLFALNSIRRMI